MIAVVLVSMCLTAPGTACAQPTSQDVRAEGLVGAAGANKAAIGDENPNAVDPTAPIALAPEDLPSLNLGTEAVRAKRPTDIVFVIDTTGSMSSYIYKVKSNLIAFVRRLKELGVNPRMALVEYRDVFVDGTSSTKIHRFGSSGSYWTRNADKMISRLNSLTVGGGGDLPETPTHALAKFLNHSSFESGSDRFVFLLTDADYKTTDSDYYSSSSITSMAKCITKLKKRSAHAIVVSEYEHRSSYYSLFTDTGGRFIDIDSSSYSTMLYSTATWIGGRVLESYKIPKATTKVGKCHFTGGAVKPKIVVKCNGKKLKYGRDYVIVYQNNRNAGSGTAIIYARGNYVGNKSITFTIQRANISNVSVHTSPMVYSGRSCRPVPDSISYNGLTLRRGVDYKIVKYCNNVNAGKRAYYKIRGIGNFRGTKRVYFTIERAPISLASASVKAVTYSGKERRPKPTVTFNGVTLRRGVDYRILGYENNVNAGKHASVSLKGKGNFKGTMKVRFTIKRAKLKKTDATVKSVVYNGKKQKPKAKLTFNGMRLKKGRDYIVTGYENNRNASHHAVILLQGQGNYKGSKRVEFTIKKAPIEDIEASVDALTYTGKALTPKLASATFNGKALEAGRDYRIVDYSHNVNAGKRACVTIRGKGNFKGTKDVRFTIKRAKLRKADMVAKAVTYNGKKRCPRLASATFNGKALEAGRDYRIVSYANNVNAGKRAVMTLEGIGNFKGTKDVRFIIKKARLKKADARVDSLTYNGKAKTPKISSASFKGILLEEGRDYKITGYSNNVNAGKQAVVKIKGKGNFKGSKQVEFKIKRADFSKARISVSPVNYTGSEVVPKMKVRRYGMKLKEGVDYTFTCKNNVNVGTAKVIFTGKGNYAGKQKATFSIERTPIYDAKVTVAEQTYTGKAVKPKPTSVTLNGRTLKLGTDYKIVRYSHNVKVGANKAEMVIKGIGGYKGRIKVPFTIAKATSEPASPKSGLAKGALAFAA